MNYSKIIALIAFGTLLSFNSIAQEKPFAESAVISTTDTPYGVFAEDASSLYSSRMSGLGTEHHLFIEKYDKGTFKTTYSKELPKYSEFQKLTRRASFDLHCFLVKDKVYCFYQYFDNKKDTMYVLLQTIAANGDVSDVYNVAATSTRNAFLGSIVKFSPDLESFFVVANPESPFISFDPNAKQVVNLQGRLYKTATLEKIWEHDISSAINGRSYDVTGFTIDNKHNLYFLLKENNRTAVLSVIGPNSPTLKQLPELVSKDLRTEGVSLQITQGGDILFAGVSADIMKDARGFYRDPGLFLRVLNPDNLEVKLTKDYPFSDDVMNKLSIGRCEKKPNADQRKANMEIYNLFSFFQVLESDDGYYFTTEDNFWALFDGAIFSKDFIVIKTLKNGDLKYQAVIPHNDRNGYMIGINTYIINQKYYILFGEATELADKKLDEYESLTMPVIPGGYGNVVMVSAGDNGALTKKVMFPNVKHELAYDCPYSPVASIYDNNKLLFVLANTKANVIKYASYKID
ncbi:MAG: hypothetical protein JWP12_139 [Bacteroidetes bacterium]|nr:hypothetical protein [Bacteroidota bacterium]